MIGLVVASVIAYICGAVPFSYIAGRVFAGIDLREHGSGNLGASNTFRFLGARVAIPVLLADMAKGFVPVALAPQLATQDGVPVDWLMLAAFFFAVMGHMFSPFVGFRGGKGIATTAGGLVALAPAALAVSFGLWALVMALTRIVSLASIIGAVSLPIVVIVLRTTEIAAYGNSYVWVAFLIAAVVVVKHRSNIKRLFAGEEPTLRRHRH